MANSRSKAVAKAVAKTVAAGGARLTFTLNADEAAEWRGLLEERGGGGAWPGEQKAALMAAIRAARARGPVTPEEALRVLDRFVKGRGK